MTFSGFARGGVVALITVLLALSGCKGSRERTLQRQGPEKLYQQARSQLRSYDRETAVRRLSAFLMRRGYSGSTVRAAVEHALPPTPSSRVTFR